MYFIDKICTLIVNIANIVPRNASHKKAHL